MCCQSLLDSAVDACRGYMDLPIQNSAECCTYSDNFVGWNVELIVVKVNLCVRSKDCGCSRFDSVLLTEFRWQILDSHHTIWFAIEILVLEFTHNRWLFGATVFVLLVSDKQDTCILALPLLALPLTLGVS